MLKKIIVLIAIISIIYIFYLNTKNNKKNIDEAINSETKLYNSNLLENIEYISKDAKGNEYIIRATKGEIDIENKDIIFLEDVRSKIKLNNSKEIFITSNYGKYNTNNYSTIFSKNVIITYIDNKITGEYLDFSLERNSMIISRDVVYTTLENVLKADVIEIDITTKDTQIFMYEKNKKVNIRSKNY